MPSWHLHPATSACVILWPIFETVSYNISKRDSHLLKLLQKLAGRVELRIITNIPSRYSSYWGDAPRKKARETIDAYLTNLNPSNFASRMQTFFRFDNHCKLVATDSMAYVGSANFSDESSDNLEAGVLIRGQALVQKVVDLIFNEAKTDAQEHGNNAVANAMIKLGSAKAQIEKLRRDLRELFYTESDPDYGRSVEYFNWEQCNADRSDLDSFIDAIDEVEGVLCNLTEDEVEIAIGNIDLRPVEVVRELLLTDGRIDVFVRHDSQQFMMAHIEQTIYDDYDKVCEDAADEELEAREKVDQAIGMLSGELNRVEGVLRGIKLPTPAVDNT